VRNKGRGWVLAGFEIVTADRPQAPQVFEASQSHDLPSLEFALDENFAAAPLPKIELTLAEHDDFDRALGREVGSRLMN
jgi:hypothetical protein